MPGRAEVARGTEVDVVLDKVDRVSVASAVFAVKLISSRSTPFIALERSRAGPQ